jgi:hypothetical protein
MSRVEPVLPLLPLRSCVKPRSVFQFQLAELNHIFGGLEEEEMHGG